MNVYKCWVPTVSGCLSFSNIKGTKIPGRADHPLTFNLLGNEHKAYIYSIQKRNLSDTIYAAWDRRGEFYYLLSAGIESAKTTSQQSKLVGKIFTYPLKSLSAVEEEIIDSLQKSNSDPTNEIQQLICLRKDNPASVVVEFTLDRDGVVELSTQEANTELSYSFVLEAYSFLRDLIHSHKFHRHDDDAIVVPYPIVDSNSEVQWAKKTLKNLHKSIVSTYRNTNYKIDIINAIGRLSYLESFQHVLSQRNITSGITINTLILRASLETRLNSIEQNGSGRSILLSIFLPIFFTVLALLIGVIQLLQVPCIKGLSYNQETCGQTSFVLPENAFEYTHAALKHWDQLAIALSIGSALLIFFIQIDSIFRWLTQSLGHGFMGWIQRITFTVAVSRRFGRLLASGWIAAVVSCMLFLAYHASRLLLS